MINPTQGIERIKANSLRDFNRLDQEKMELHNKVYEGYRKILDENHGLNMKEVDASREIKQVFAEVYRIVKTFIEGHCHA
jgi:dTMP kinase